MEELLSATITGVPPNREDCTQRTEDTGLHFIQGSETARYVGGLSVCPLSSCVRNSISHTTAVGGGQEERGLSSEDQMHDGINTKLSWEWVDSKAEVRALFSLSPCEHQLHHKKGAQQKQAT